MKELETREEENDHFRKEEPPDEDKELAKYGYVINTPAQEKLNKYKQPQSTNVMTSQRKTLDIAKMLTNRRAHQKEDVANA
jgi:hypothetical protein